MDTVIPFYTPIWISHTDMNMDKAVKTCMDMEVEKGVVLSNMGGFQSKSFSEREFSNNFKEIHAFIDEQIKIIADKTQSKYVFSNAWCNINRKNNYNSAHVHPNSSLSGCIYLKTCKGSGKIIFSNPTPIMHYELNDNIDGFFSSYWYEPTVGDVVFFPSYLLHHVEPNIYDEPRVSIAFNFVLSK